MLPLAMVLGALSPQEGVVQSVEVRTVFAGRLGRRILTDVTVAVQGRPVSFRIQDVRHTKFQAPKPSYRVGERVNVVGGRLLRTQAS